MKILAIALGGSLGALSRFFVSGYVQQLIKSAFPWGTLTVNLIGSFAIGFLTAFFAKIVPPNPVKLFFIVGFLGSLTTFSAFSLENYYLLKNGQYKLLLFHSIITITGCLLLTILGFILHDKLSY